MGCIWTVLGNRLETAWKRPSELLGNSIAE